MSNINATVDPTVDPLLINISCWMSKNIISNITPKP